MGYDNFFLLYNDGSGWKVWPEYMDTQFRSVIVALREEQKEFHPQWKFKIVKEDWDSNYE